MMYLNICDVCRAEPQFRSVLSGTRSLHVCMDCDEGLDACPKCADGILHDISTDFKKPEWICDSCDYYIKPC